MATTVASSRESLLDGQKRILALINEDRPLEETLDAICRLVDTQADGMFSSVLLLDESGQHLLHGAAPHLPEDYCRAIHGISIGDGVGSCGTAAARGESVIVDDIANHPYWAPFKGLAHDVHGLGACWSTPIRAYDGKVLATFAIYHNRPKSPTLQERKLIDFMMQMLLEDRFKMKIRRETREFPVYELSVGKGSPKLQAATKGGCNRVDINNPPPAPTAGRQNLRCGRRGLNRTFRRAHQARRASATDPAQGQ